MSNKNKLVLIDSLILLFETNVKQSPHINKDHQTNPSIKVDDIEEEKRLSQNASTDELSFDLNVTEQQIIETRDIYQKHIKTWGIDGNYTQLEDINILYCLTISRIKGNNFLLNIIDSYRRDTIADLIQIENKNIYHEMDSEKARIEKWISSRPFLKQLNDKIQNVNLNVANHKCKLDLQSLIQTYPRRIAPGFGFSDKLIDDELEAVSKWLVTSSQFVDTLINKITKGLGGPPFLIDFMILLNPSIDKNDSWKQDNEEDDDDDDDDDASNAFLDALVISSNSSNNVSCDIIGNFIHHLQQTDCKLSQSEFCNVTEQKDSLNLIARKYVKKAFTELRAQVGNRDGSYPMNRRFNIVIDRRDICKINNDGKDRLVLFEPPFDCNKLSHVRIPECYFDLSRLCLIPRPGYGKKEAYGLCEIDKLKQETITAMTTSQGQILTLSYHIWAADEIKCYLLWNGRCHRFYPQDILELLPHMFRKDTDNVNFAKSEEVKDLIAKMFIKDESFEQFYRKINRLTKNEFPKK